MGVVQFLRRVFLVLASTICSHSYSGNQSVAAAFNLLPSLSGHRSSKIYIGQSLPRMPAANFNRSSSNNDNNVGGLWFTADFDDTALDMLRRMTLYFSDMVDDSTNRFYGLSRPPSGEKVHVQCPLRDLGAAWDAATLLLFWKNEEQQRQQQQYLPHDCEIRLQNAVLGTIKAYRGALLTTHGNGGTTALSSEMLREPSNIAHSGFLVLVATSAVRLSFLCNDSFIEKDYARALLPMMDALTRGILSMQRPDDGAFCIEFSGDGDNVYKGIEFFPGEAMVALLEVYQLSKKVPGLLEESTQLAILPALRRAVDFYADYYRQGNVDTNYNIWQIQAFARLFHALNNEGKDLDSKTQAAVVANYVLELCRNIVTSQSWRMLSRGRSFYPNLQTVEIACGLDAVIEGVRVALTLARDEDVRLLWSPLSHAVDFLSFVQDQVPSDAATGFGGLGYGGIQVLEQRLDVTGHATSALIKVYRVLQSSRLQVP